MARRTPKTLEQSEEDTLWAALHSGPAPFVNRMGVNPLDLGVRLSFAEQFPLDDPPTIHWRGGVTLSDWHAYQLWQLLGNLKIVQDVDSRIRAQAFNQEPGGGSTDT